MSADDLEILDQTGWSADGSSFTIAMRNNNPPRNDFKNIYGATWIMEVNGEQFNQYQETLTMSGGEELQETIVNPQPNADVVAKLGALVTWNGSTYDPVTSGVSWQIRFPLGGGSGGGGFSEANVNITNCGITSPSQIEPNTELTWEVTVSNTNNTHARATLAPDVIVDGTNEGGPQSGVEIPAGGSQTIEFSVVPRSTGTYDVQTEIVSNSISQL